MDTLMFDVIDKDAPYDTGLLDLAEQWREEETQEEEALVELIATTANILTSEARVVRALEKAGFKPRSTRDTYWRYARESGLVTNGKVANALVKFSQKCEHLALLEAKRMLLAARNPLDVDAVGAFARKEGVFNHPEVRAGLKAADGVIVAHMRKYPRVLVKGRERVSAYSPGYYRRMVAAGYEERAE